jgi:hypothetical protein
VANFAASRRSHPSQWLALLVGAFYTILGAGGFFVTGFSGFAAPQGDLLLGLELNPLQNLVHLALGAAGLFLWRRLATAVTYGWVVALVSGLLFAYGLAVAGTDAPANVLALNTSGNALHFITAIYGVIMAIWPKGMAATAEEGPRELIEERREERGRRPADEHTERRR